MSWRNLMNNDKKGLVLNCRLDSGWYFDFTHILSRQAKWIKQDNMQLPIRFSNLLAPAHVTWFQKTCLSFLAICCIRFTDPWLSLFYWACLFLEEEKVTTILCRRIEWTRDTTMVYTTWVGLVVGTFGVLINSKPFLSAIIYYVIIAEVLMVLVGFIAFAWCCLSLSRLHLFFFSFLELFAIPTYYSWSILTSRLILSSYPLCSCSRKFP